MTARGEIWLVRADKVRPAIVLTRDPVADVLNEILVVPITSARRNLLTEVQIGSNAGIDRPSIANLDQVRRLDRSRFVRRIGQVDTPTMTAICAAMQYSIGC